MHCMLAINISLFFFLQLKFVSSRDTISRWMLIGFKGSLLRCLVDIDQANTGVFLKNNDYLLCMCKGTDKIKIPLFKLQRVITRDRVLKLSFTKINYDLKSFIFSNAKYKRYMNLQHAILKLKNCKEKKYKNSNSLIIQKVYRILYIIFF